MNAFGPYGSIPVNSKPTNIIRTPFYNQYGNIYSTPCIPYCCQDIIITLPGFITSNISLTTNTIIHIYTDFGLSSNYKVSNGISNTLYNISDITANTTANTTSKQDTIILMVDSHTKGTEKFGSIKFTLTNTNSILSINKSITGDQGTIFNVVITYNNINNIDICNNGLKHLTFNIISINIAYL